MLYERAGVVSSQNSDVNRTSSQTAQVLNSRHILHANYVSVACEKHQLVRIYALFVLQCLFLDLVNCLLRQENIYIYMQYALCEE